MAMTPLSLKKYPVLLCGIFLFLILETKSDQTTNENVIHTAAAEHPSTTQPHHAVTPVQPDKPRAEAPADTSLHITPLSPTVDQKNSETTATGNDLLRFHQNQTDKTTAAHSGSISGTEKPPHTETASSKAQPSKVPVTEATPTEVKSPEQKSTLLPKSLTVQEMPAQTTTLPPLPLTRHNTSAITETKQPAVLPEITTAHSHAPALTTETAPSNSSAIIDTTTTTALIVTTLPSVMTTTTAATAAAAQTTLSGKPNTTDESSTNGTTQAMHTETTAKNLSTTAASQSTTDSSVSTAPLSSQSQVTEHSPSTMFSTVHNTTNSTGGILIPVRPKELSTIKPKTTTVTPHTEAQPCSSIGVVKQCLIAIASLAAVATVFAITTIVLCLKLSSRKYRVRRHQQGTEMMCISSLLPERSHQRHNYSRQRSPVPNGVLVIHNCDSDDDIGDNLTLSSFLPENDRFV